MIRSSAISRGLCMALLATSARAQNVAAGARAVVNGDTLPVYASMSTSSAVKATLSRGDAVTIGLVLFGDDTTWCAVSKSGETRRLGYAACEFLEQERSTSPGPVNTTPAPAPKKFVVREAPRDPITIREAPLLPQTPSSEPLETLSSIREPLPARPPEPTPAPEPAGPVPAALPSATPAADTRVDLVALALEGSGLRANLTRYVQTTHLVSFLDKGRLAEIEVPLVERALAVLFRTDTFSRAIAEQMRRSQSPERLKTLVEWLQSPLTRKIVELESRALEPEAHEELVAFAASLRSAPPPESRLRLIHRLFDATQTCGMEVDTTIGLVKAVAQAIGPALPEEKRYTAAELNRALGAVKPRYTSIMKNARLVHYLFALQTVADEEVEQHVSFLESEDGKWFAEIVRRGFSDATGAISRNLRAEILHQIKLKQR